MKFHKFLPFALTASLVGANLSTFSISASAADTIEPGSPESFIYWTGSTLDYVDNVLSSNNVAEWGVSTIGYALDMRSLLVAYSNWYDNQSNDNPNIAWTSRFGYVGIYNPVTLEYDNYPLYVTGTTTYVSGNFSLPNLDLFAHLPFSRLINIYNRELFPSLPQIGTASGNFPSFAAPAEVGHNFLESSSTSPSVGIIFDDSVHHYSRTSLYRPIRAYSPDILPTHNLAFHFGDSFVDLWNDMLALHPDADKTLLPDITPPVNDVDFNEEPTEPETHPDGCCCEVHVYVTVDVNNAVEFPTYNVQDIPEPSAFDFQSLETVSHETFPALDFGDYAEDISSGMSFWSEMLQFFVDSFNIQTLVLLALGIALLMFFIMR